MPPASALEPLPASVTPLSSLLLTPITLGQPPFQTYPKSSIADERPQQDIQVKNRVFNYYFLFLAILVAAMATLLWWMYRKRRHEQEEIRLRGQRALSRDVERWAIQRRNQSPIVEGLNESGEAPPPYKPKEDSLGNLELNNVSCEQTRHIEVPQRALWQGSVEQVQLPDYVKTVQVRDDGRHSGPTRPAASAITACVGDSTPRELQIRIDIPTITTSQPDH